MIDKSHLTAITRKTLPVPTRWLLKNNKVTGKVLDYGCGRCASVNPRGWKNFDPHYEPAFNLEENYFDTILCNYVLCVLSPELRIPVLKEIQKYLSPTGTAYVSVRNDKPTWGWGVSKRGTYQGRVTKIAIECIYQNSQFRIYHLTKNTDLK